MADFFGPAETLEVLRGLNPWWAGRQGEVPPFRRLAYDACRLYLEEASFRRAVLLSGPRRVGKTTVLNQIAQDLVAEGHDPTSVMYLSLDHPLLKLQRLPAILDVYHEHIRPKGPPVTLLLDEVQYASDWELELKQLVDRAPTYRILATGSASVAHRQRLAESGVGRWMEVHMPTLSFYEFMHLAKADRPNVPPDLRPTDLFTASSDRLIRDTRLAFRDIQPVFERYLLVGGFPETASSAADVPLCQRLLREDVVERVLKRDMTELFGIRKVGDLERLFIYLCMHTGSILAVQKCARALDANADTVANHLEALEQANLIYRLEPYRIGGKKVLKVRHKVYLVDAALRNAVLLRGEEILRDPDQLGVIVETAVLRHLYAYYYRDVPRVSYWRDSKTGQEVDVIVSSPAYLFPAEVKYRAKARVSENDGIAAFCRQVGVRRAFWVTRNDEDFAVTRLPGIETDFLQVPAHIFLYLLGQAERLLWTR